MSIAQLCTILMLFVGSGTRLAADESSLLAQQAQAIRAEMKWAQPGDDADEKAIHDALGEHVFAKVTISPEGRVKVGRGPAEAALSWKKPGRFLVQIENQSGGQQRLKLLGTYTGDAENPFALSIRKAGLFGTDLLGLPVEYRLIEVTSAKAGKHELTITVEAGQGSQDLGFRAEVPILFSVETK